MARTESTMLALGTSAPTFGLTDAISGSVITRDHFKGNKAMLVMFICPHCPYVKHIEKELGALGRAYQDKSVAIVAINSNDAAAYPADNPDGMRAQAEAFDFNFPYLIDESQEVAKAYQAACTPDFYLFDADFQLVYRGQFDGSRPNQEKAATGCDLRAAIDAVLADTPVTADQCASLGCNIKWKQ